MEFETKLSTMFESPQIDSVIPTIHIIWYQSTVLTMGTTCTEAMNNKVDKLEDDIQLRVANDPSRVK